jgi:hypothetical protein
MWGHPDPARHQRPLASLRRVVYQLAQVLDGTRSHPLGSRYLHPVELSRPTAMLLSLWHAGVQLVLDYPLDRLLP